MDKDYDAVQAKFCASLLWFVCRVREDGSCDVIPQVTSPMQLVKGRVVVKAAVVEYLTSAQMYTAVVSTILQCRVSTVWDLLPTLAEHRVHVTDNDEPVLESDIMERKPFKMSTHLAVMDAIMEMYANKLVSIQKIISTVRSIFPFDTHSRDSPFDLEDALLQWMNKVNEANNMETSQHTKQVFPQMSDVHECLQDGISILSLLLYYTSDVLHIEEMKLAKRLVASEREHNIELFRRLCAQFVTTSVFALRIEDFANAHQFLKTNFVCLLAEIFHKLTRVKQPQQQLDEEASLPRVMEDNFVKEQPSSIHQQPLLDRRQKMNSSTVPVYQTSGGSRNERPPPLRNTQGASMQRNNINTTLLGYKDGVKLVEEALHNRGIVRKAEVEEALHHTGVRKAEEEPIPYTPCISRPSSSKKENPPTEETNSNRKTSNQPPEDHYESVKIPDKASHTDNNYATSSAGNNHLDSWDFEADVRKEPPAVVARYESTEDDDDVLSTITEGTEPEAPSLYSFHSDDTMHDSSIEEGLIGDDIYYADDKPSIEQTGDEELDSTLLEEEEEEDSQILVEKQPARNALSSQPLNVGVSYIINETSVETALASGIPVIEGLSNDDNSSPSVSKTFSQSDKSANRNYLASSQADDPLTSSSQDKQRQQQTTLQEKQRQQQTALQEKQRQQQTALQEKQRQQQKVKKDNDYDDFDVKSSYVLQSREIEQSSNAEEGQKKRPEKVVNSLSLEPLTTSNTKKEDLPESTNEQPLTIPYQKSENRSANEQQPIEKKTKTEEPPKKLADDNIFDIEEFIRQNKRFPSEREMFPPGRRKGWPFTQMGKIPPPVIHLNWGELSRKPGKKTWAELVGGKPRQPLGDLEKQKEKYMELFNTKKSGEGKKMCWIDEVNKKKKSQDISEATEEHAWYTSPKYAAVRLQLQEQRRRYAEKKKNEEQQWREERAKGLQDAFVMMVLNQEKENEDPSSYEFDQPPAEQKEQSPIAEERSPGLWFVGIPGSQENISTASDSKPPEEILPETEKVREVVHTEQQMSSHQPAVEPQKSNFSPPKSNFSPQSASSNRIPPSHSQPGFTKPEKDSSEHLPSTNQQATTYPAPSSTYPPSQPTNRLPINQLHHFSVNPSAQPLVDQQFTQPLVDQQFTKDQSTDQTNRTFSQESSGHQNQSSFVPSLSEQLSSQPDHSSSRPNHPSSRPDQPSSQPDNPSSRPDHPSSRPDNPSGRPDHPSSQPDNPTSRLGVENEAVDEPKKSSLQKLKELSNSTSIDPTEHPTNATVTIESNRQQQIHEHNANSTYTQQHQQSLQEQQQQIQDDHWQQQQHQQHQEKQQYNQQQQQIKDDHWRQQQHQEKQQYNQQQQQIQDDHWQQQQHEQKQQYNQQQQQIQDDNWQQQQHEEKQQYNQQQQQQQYQQHQGQQQGQHSFYQQQNQTYLLKTQIKDHMGYNNLQPVIEQKNQNIGQQNLNQQHFEQTNGQHFEQQNQDVPNQHKTFTVPPQHQEQHFQQFDQQHSQQINQQKHQPQQHFERQEQQPQQINQQSQHVDQRQQINKQTQQLNDQYQSQQHQRQQIAEQNSNQSQQSQQQQQTQQHQSQQINDHQQTLQQQQSTFLVTPQKVDQKSCTFTLTDNDVPTEMTPEQLKKKERFLKNRQKRQEQERLKKEKKAREEERLLEAKQLEEERRTEEMTLKEQHERRRKEQLEEEQVREETERLQNEMMNKRVHGITYSTMQRRQDSSEDLRSNSASRATRISSNSSENVRKPPRQQSAPPPLSSQLPKDNPPTHSVYSEYKGPVVYTKPSGKSNRKIIQNAIAHCCLCGEVNREAKNKCLEALSLSEGSHFLVLFREGLKFRSVYDYNPDTQVVTRIYGIGPKSITPKMITKYFKYNSGGKAFNSLDTLHLSIQVDGVMIKKEMWEGRKAKPAKK